MMDSQKDRNLQKRFAARMTPDLVALTEGTAFFETLFPLISIRKADDLPKEFFDLKRSARIIARRELRGDDEEFGLAQMMQKPALLLEIFDIKPVTPSQRHKKSRRIDPSSLGEASINEPFVQAAEPDAQQDDAAYDQTPGHPSSRDDAPKPQEF